MSGLSKNLKREIIKDGSFQNPGEILSYLKDAMKEMQEMDMSLGYEKNDKAAKTTDNCRKHKFRKFILISKYSCDKLQAIKQ